MSPESQSGTLWQGVLSRIRERISVQQFDTWFRGVEPGAISEEVLELMVPNSFSKEWLRRKYADVILGAVEPANGGRRPVLRIVVREGGEVARGEPAPAALQLEDRDVGRRPAPSPREVLPAAWGDEPAGGPRPSHSSPPPTAADAPPPPFILNRDFRFRNFVVGAKNRLAHAAALGVVERDEPLFHLIYVHGGVGLGKTHLLQATAHHLLEARTDRKVRYLSGEQFTNQYIAAVEKGQIDAFRTRLREVDVLIVDDVHFLANKDRTQEEFLHTFNALHDRQKLVIVSADAPPGELQGLSERLASRLRGGLVCSLDSPDFEMRAEIVRRKAERLGQALPEDIARYIAENVRSNVRELEGAVTRVIGQACLACVTLDVQLAREILRDLTLERRPRVSLEQIAQAVTARYGVKLSELQSKRRTQAIAVPRQICMYLARRHTGHSLEEIGGYFGGRDHSTVLYGIERTGTRIDRDPEFRATVETLSAQVFQGGAP